MDTNYYEILGVQASASQDVIKRQYRLLSMKHHPDRGGDPQKMASLNEAYNVLSNPVARSSFDQSWRHSQDEDFIFTSNTGSSTTQKQAPPKYATYYTPRAGKQQKATRLQKVGWVAFAGVFLASIGFIYAVLSGIGLGAASPLATTPNVPTSINDTPTNTNLSAQQSNDASSASQGSQTVVTTPSSSSLSNPVSNPTTSSDVTATSTPCSTDTCNEGISPCAYPKVRSGNHCLTQQRLNKLFQ